MVIEIFSPTKLVILNSLSIGYISGQAKGGIDNQFLINGFSIILLGYLQEEQN